MAHLAITALELTNHGPFHGRHRFEVRSDGLGVQIGPNESGKTTFFEAVAAVLWGKTETSRNWASTNREPHQGAVEFIRTESRHARQFRVERDFDSNEVVAWLLDADGSRCELFRSTHNPSGRTVDNNLWPERRLPELWALLSCDAFRHVAMLTQRPESMDAGLVQELVTGSGSDTISNPHPSLVDRFRSISRFSRDAGLTSHNARSDGRLEQLQSEAEQLRSGLRDAAGKLERSLELRDKLQGLDQQVQDRVDRVTKARNSLDTIERHRELRRELERATQQATQLKTATQHAQASAQEIRAADEQVAGLPEQLRSLDGEEFQRFSDRIDDYRVRRAGLIDLQEFARKRRELEHEYADVSNWPDNALEPIQHLREAVDRVEVARGDFERLNRQLDTLQLRSAVIRRLVVAAVVGLVAAAAIIVGAPSWHWAIAISAGVLAAAVTWSFYRSHKVCPDHDRITSELPYARYHLASAEQAAESARKRVQWTDETSVTRLVQLGERRRTLARELAELAKQETQQEKLRAELDPAKLPEPLPRLFRFCRGNLEEVRERLKRAQQAQRKREAAEKRMAPVLDAVQCKDLKELESKLREWDDRRVGIRGQLDEQIKNSALAEELQQMQGAEVEALRLELERQCDEYRCQIEQLDAQRRDDQRQLDHVERSVEINVAEAERQLQEIGADIDRLKARCEAIKQAHRLLQVAAERYSARHREAIEKRIDDLMATWTRVRDRRFTVAGNLSLGLVIRTANGQEEGVELSTLSQGARDQLALAARIAVLERLGGNVVLPLLVDDAFLTWDHQRREHLRAALNATADRRQVILTSHDPQFGDWGTPVNHRRESLG